MQSARRRSRGMTAAEAAVVAAKLDTPAAAVAKQRMLSTHWQLESANRSSTPVRRRSAKRTTRAEAEAIAAKLSVKSLAETRRMNLESHWTPAAPKASTPATTSGAAHHAPRLTTPSEAAILANKLQTAAPRDAKNRMLQGSWQPEMPAASAQPAAVHRRPRGMQGVDTRPLQEAACGRTASRGDNLASHWSVGNIDEASSGSQNVPPATTKAARSKKSKSSNDSAAARVRVPSAQELRMRNSCSHWTLGSDSATPGKKKSDDTTRRTVTNTRPSGGRRGSGSGPVNAATMQASSGWHIAPSPPTATPRKARAVAPPAVPPAASVASQRERTDQASAFRHRNQRSQWSLGDGSASTSSSRQRQGRTRNTRPAACPPPAPQVSAHVRKQQAFTSTFTLG